MATVHPAENFSYAQDGEKLKGEIKGFGTDEQAIIAILTSRSQHQREAIVKYFKEEYNRDILEELKEELGEKFDDLTYALVASTTEYFCYELHSLLEAENLDERALIEIACSRTIGEIKEIASQYTKSYERPLIDHISSESPVRRLVSAIINGANSDKSVAEVIKGEASDAAAIAAEYIQNPIAFYANSLNKAFESEVGHKTFTRIIVTRSENDLGTIKKEYERLFNRNLGGDVKSKSSDDYKKALSTLVGDN